MESGARTQASARLPAAAPLLTGAAAGEQPRGSGCRTATVRTDRAGWAEAEGAGPAEDAGRLPAASPAPADSLPGPAGGARSHNPGITP